MVAAIHSQKSSEERAFPLEPESRKNVRASSRRTFETLVGSFRRLNNTARNEPHALTINRPDRSSSDQVSTLSLIGIRLDNLAHDCVVNPHCIFLAVANKRLRKTSGFG